MFQSFSKKILKNNFKCKKQHQKMNDLLNKTDSVGGIMYFIHNLAIYLPYFTIISLANIIGSIGNVQTHIHINIREESFFLNNFIYNRQLDFNW